METLRSVQIAVLTLVLQAFSPGLAEDLPCSTGFDSDVFIFKVHSEHLHPGMRIGRVLFSDCSSKAPPHFVCPDERFEVDADGTVMPKRQMTLHKGQEALCVQAWDSEGRKHTVPVRVEVARSPQSIDHQTETKTHTCEEPKENINQPVFQPEVNVPQVPRSSQWLKRRKREWLIPPIFILENDAGPFPKMLARIRSSLTMGNKHAVYSLTGSGANLPPQRVFTIDKSTGTLYVTQPLDRETQDKYELQVRVASLSGDVNESPIDIHIPVIDTNDNAPVFDQEEFLGSVPESSPIGYQFMTIKASDADLPNTEHSMIKYSIIGQDPGLPNANMFSINPMTGGIRVNASGLDKEKNPTYTLEIQATDMNGEGLSCKGKAVVTVIGTVTDINDNAPQFESTSYVMSVPENAVGEFVVRMPVTDADEPHSPAWWTKYKIVDGDSDGVFRVLTGPSLLEGIIITAQPLDYEKVKNYVLLVAVENADPFASPLSTSTATVTVNVQDVYEPV